MAVIWISKESAGILLCFCRHVVETSVLIHAISDERKKETKADRSSASSCPTCRSKSYRPCYAMLKFRESGTAQNIEQSYPPICGISCMNGSLNEYFAATEFEEPATVCGPALRKPVWLSLISGFFKASAARIPPCHDSSLCSWDRCRSGVPATNFGKRIMNMAL